MNSAVGLVDERKINRFLEKRGHKSEVEVFKELKSVIDEALKSGEVTSQQLLAGTAPEHYQKNYDNMIKYAVKLDYLVSKHLTEAKSKGAEFEKEIRAIDAEIDNEDRFNLKPGTYEEEPEERNKLEQAKQAYLENPNEENSLKYVKNKLFPGDISPEAKFNQEDNQRADKFNRAMKEIEDKTIENVARAEVNKRIKLKRMETGNNFRQEERREALGDPRLNKNVATKNPGEMDKKITARMDEIVAEDSA